MLGNIGSAKPVGNACSSELNFAFSSGLQVSLNPEGFGTLPISMAIQVSIVIFVNQRITGQQSKVQTWLAFRVGGGSSRRASRTSR